MTGRSVLSFGWPGAQHAILALWSADRSFSGWYVNLEQRLGRSRTTYDFVDHCLDVLIPPDRSTWTWKDEDELEEAVRLGIFTPDDAERFRAHARIDIDKRLTAPAYRFDFMNQILTVAQRDVLVGRRLGHNSPKPS